MVSNKDSAKLHKNEGIKAASQYLRGTILEGLADTSTGSISGDDSQLTKFHGIYLQDDRDLRKERLKAKLEKAFSFMVRIRVPGGVCTPQQWLHMDALADKYANGTLKLTTRQAYQIHGVLKRDLKASIAAINEGLLDTIAACGDVNRNVMCTANPEQSKLHATVSEHSKVLSNHLTPQTPAYHEIWLDGKLVAGGEPVEEPIYGKTYLPRKFKSAFVVPPYNDVDIFSQDLGFIAITDENGQLAGYNVAVGGGMGMTHNKTKTFPRLADIIGFITPDQMLPVAEAIVTTQRDHGDRTDRKHARLKYTIEDHGIEWFKKEVEQRSKITLQPKRPFTFKTTSDRYGWIQGTDGLWCLNLFILSGRVKDSEELKTKACLREIAKIHQGDFRLTANQNLVLGKITDADRPQIETILEEYGLLKSHHQSGLRLNSLSCVALPTCGLALAESERLLPNFVSALEKILEEVGLRDDAITLRITGCPNGCARPYLGEIGLVGRAPGKYNVYLGAGFDGMRLNKRYLEAKKVPEILEALEKIIRHYASDREQGEAFGNFVIRTGYVKATLAGRDFHEN